MIERLRFLWTVVQMMVTVTIVIILMYIFRSKNRVIRKVWGKIQVKLLGIKVEIIGTADSEANMIAMNHQSLVDIIMMEYLHPQDIAWVAKKEIADLPWFGHILKAPDMIIIERESKSSLVKLLKNAKEKFDNNRPVAIFPEGTRTDGKKLRKFKVGAKMIANKNKFKVQPIVITGTREIFGYEKFKQKGGVVKIIYLPTVQAEKGSTWYEDMEATIGETLAREIA